MMVVRLYGLKKCGTCAKAMAWLAQHDVKYEFTDYREQPVTASLLTAWAVKLGGFEKLVNRASMTWRNLPAERKAPQSSAEWLALIAEFPALVRRPVMVLDADTVTTGFSDKKYAQIFTRPAA
jgi:Spx/MgsR family transcriptional regulator